MKKNIFTLKKIHKIFWGKFWKNVSDKVTKPLN